MLNLVLSALGFFYREKTPEPEIELDIPLPPPPPPTLNMKKSNRRKSASLIDKQLK
jgi:hypothetical protein